MEGKKTKTKKRHHASHENQEEKEKKVRALSHAIIDHFLRVIQ
jgi:hypothetical protein